MEVVLFIIYLFAGAAANSFIKHNVFGMRTVYVFNTSNFLTEKMVMAALLGWISIPVAIILSICGVGKPKV